MIRPDRLVHLEQATLNDRHRAWARRYRRAWRHAHGSFQAVHAWWQRRTFQIDDDCVSRCDGALHLTHSLARTTGHALGVNRRRVVERRLTWRGQIGEAEREAHTKRLAVAENAAGLVCVGRHRLQCAQPGYPLE